MSDCQGLYSVCSGSQTVKVLSVQWFKSKRSHNELPTHRRAPPSPGPPTFGNARPLRCPVEIKAWSEGYGLKMIQHSSLPRTPKRTTTGIWEHPQREIALVDKENNHHSYGIFASGHHMYGLVNEPRLSHATWSPTTVPSTEPSSSMELRSRPITWVILHEETDAKNNTLTDSSFWGLKIVN